MSTLLAGDPMTVIKLSGPLARRFGRIHRRCLDVRSFKDACRALGATLPGFDEEIRRLDRLGMRFAIFRNGRNIGQDEFERGGAREVRIVPIAEGSKRSGSFQTVLGAVLIAVGFVLSFTPLAAASPFFYKVGASFMISGALQMLSPQAKGLMQAARQKTCRPMPSVAPRTPRPVVIPCPCASATADGAGRLSRRPSRHRTPIDQPAGEAWGPAQEAR